MTHSRTKPDKEWWVANTLAPIAAVLLLVNIAATVVANFAGMSPHLSSQDAAVLKTAADTLFAWEAWALYWGIAAVLILAVLFIKQPTRR